MTALPSATSVADPLVDASDLHRAELAYRRILRLLPAPYRRDWEADLLGAYLDGVAARLAAVGAGPVPLAVSLSDRLDIARLAARLHLSGDPSTGKAFIWGEALRRMVLVALLAQVGFAALALCQLAARIAGEGPGTGWGESRGEILLTVGSLTITVLTSLLWVSITWLLITHRRAPMRVACLAQVAWVFATSGFNASAAGLDRQALVVQALEPTVSAVAAALLLAALVLAFHPDAPPVNRRAWLTRFAASAVAGVVVFAAAPSAGADPNSTAIGWQAFATTRCAALACLAGVCTLGWLATSKRRRRGHLQRRVMLALLLALVWSAAGVFAAALSLAQLAIGEHGGPATTLAPEAFSTAIAIVMATAFALHARHLLHRYPDQASMTPHPAEETP